MNALMNARPEAKPTKCILMTSGCRESVAMCFLESRRGRAVTFIDIWMALNDAGTDCSQSKCRSILSDLKKRGRVVSYQIKNKTYWEATTAQKPVPVAGVMSRKTKISLINELLKSAGHDQLTQVIKALRGDV